MLRDAASDAKLELTSLRNTGGHEMSTLDGLRGLIPNHCDIAEGTGRWILRQEAAKLGEEWWT